MDDDDKTAGYASDNTPIDPGASFGRYKIRSLLGAGGVGAVFLADDPLLDRTVAVKVLRTRDDEASLLKEGQVMAKLNHPNVIHVYDVGHQGETVFVAMEHVHGPTLKVWLEQPRTLAEIIDVFVQAGRGLAAAHASGLVHRDFTLSNVMVDSDGRVLVTDFGLARTTSTIGKGSGELPSRGSLDQTSVDAGTICGTPAYMSPEQHDGSPVDPRSDVFSFCVAMWRALFGEAPFAGRTWKEVAASARRGVVAEPAEPRRAPRHVRAALERGLRPDPGDRWPAMDPLLAVLAGRRRRALLVGASLGALAALGIAGYVVLRPVADPCAAATNRLAGIWDANVRAAVRGAFVATGEPQAATIFDTLARALDERVTAWEAMRRDSCEATSVRHDQSDTAFDLRAACLDGKLAELGAFVHQLETGSKPAVYRATDAVQSVGDVATCSDATVLARRVPLPSDPQRRTAIAALEAEAQRDTATTELGIPLAAGTATDLVARAKALDYPPLSAYVLTAAARDELVAMRLTGAEELLEQALLQADAGGDDPQRFAIELGLGRVVGIELDRFDDGRRHLDRASALFVRTGGGASREAQLLGAQALLELRRGQLAAAEKLARTALDRSAGHDVDRASYLGTLAGILDDADRPKEALQAADEAIAIDERLLGPRHPRTAAVLMPHANAYRLMHVMDKALADLVRAVDIYRTTLGDDAFNTGAAYANLGMLQDSMKQFDQAEASLRHAYDIYAKVHGPAHSRTMRILFRIGATQVRAKHLDAAEPTLHAALDGLRKILGENHRQVADAYFELGKLEIKRNKPRDALGYLEAAAASLRASEGDKSKLLRRVYQATGDAHVDVGDPAAACKDYEAALAVAGDDPSGGQHRGELEHAYADAMFRVGRRDQALAMAKSARQRFVGLGPSAKDDVAEVDRWIAERFPNRRE